MKKLLTTLAAILFCCSAFATHFAGAYLRYEYTGNNNDYKVILTLYKACEPSSVNLSLSETISISSSTCTPSTSNLVVNNVSIDTLSPSCPFPANSCNTTGFPVPGFIVHVYTGIVSLPACSDWTLAWASGNRNGGLVNIQNPTSASIHIEATLNNSIAFNTTPFQANIPPYIVSTHNTSTIPVHATDPEGDSIVYEMIQPFNNVGNPVPYAAGYSFAQPLGAGGSVSLIGNNQYLQLLTNITGKFALATRIKEYRAGVMVGSSILDYTVYSLPGNSLTVPMPAPNTQFNYVTCPGQTSNTISFTAEDSTLTDSVHLTVTSPNLPGWTFNTITTSGLGQGNATITFSTPANLNPATLPHFFFIIEASDNGCPKAKAKYAIAVQTAQCNTDSVWAGDANGDYTVNMYDPLAISIAYGQTGPVRPNATTNWQAEWCGTWSNNFMNNVNMKHADCNGDGVVNSSDLAAITANYNMVHTKGNHTPMAKTNGIPDLYFDMTGVTLTPGTTVAIPVKLGNSSSSMQNMYGIAGEIKINNLTPAGNSSLTFPSSTWMGNSANMVQFTKVVNNNIIAFAYAKTDHQNVSGEGTIAMLNFTIPNTTPIGQQIDLYLDGVQIINKDGAEMTEGTDYNVVGASGNLAWPTSVNNMVNNIANTIVAPNPSHTNASLYINLKQAASINVSVTDITGKIVWQHEIAGQKGEQTVQLPANEIANGIYTIQVQNEGAQPQVLKWVKQ